MPGSKILEIKHLNTWFETPFDTIKAVTDVNLALNQGQVLGVVGESGCGKSVLAKSIIGLVDPPGRIISGSILYQGKELVSCSEREYRLIRGKKIAYIIQNPMSSFNPAFSIRHQLESAIRLHHNCSRAQAASESLELLWAVKIGNPREVGDAYPHQLSGGMLQRAAIAMAISGNPDILIGDEPTTALDVSVQAEILALLGNLNRERQMSMMIITHNFGVIWEICHRVIVMYAGNMVEEASVEDIYQNPLHPYTLALFNSVLSMDHGRQETLPYLKGSVNQTVSSGCAFAGRCIRAKEICYSKAPVRQEVEEDHFVCCHFFSKGETGL